MKRIVSLDACKQEILNKLQEAGAKGIGKTLLIGSSKPKAGILQELETNGQVVNLGSLKKACYILQQFNNPLEIAYGIIEKNASSVKAGLFTEKELSKGCSGELAKKSDEAIKWLLKEKKLLQLKRGKTSYFLHISGIQDFLPAIQSPDQAIVCEEPKALSALSREQVSEAYEKLRQRILFSDVEIYELQQELGCDIELLKSFLLEESREGKAVLSFGDWSLSSEATRSCAIYIRGKAHLLVRFKE